MLFREFNVGADPAKMSKALAFGIDLIEPAGHRPALKESRCLAPIALFRRTQRKSGRRTVALAIEKERWTRFLRLSRSLVMNVNASFARSPTKRLICPPPLNMITGEQALKQFAPSGIHALRHRHAPRDEMQKEGAIVDPRKAAAIGNEFQQDDAETPPIGRGGGGVRNRLGRHIPARLARACHLDIKLGKACRRKVCYHKP